MKLTNIVEELRLRAWQERAVSTIGRTSKIRTAEHEHAAKQLENLADAIELGLIVLDGKGQGTGEAS